MKSNLKSMLLGILIVVLVAWALLVWFAGLQKEVAAGIIAGLTAVGSVVISKIDERKSEIRRELRAKKVPCYEKSMKFWFRELLADKPGQKRHSKEEIVQHMQEFNQQLIIWGSDSVLKAFTTFREAFITLESGKPPDQAIFLFEKYMLEIRKDLGHKNVNLESPGDILALFVDDIRKNTGTDN